MSSSSSRRSAKEVHTAHQTTGKPVWTSSDSEQIVSLSPLSQPDFILQDEYCISSGILDVDTISSKLSILQGISSIDAMRKILYGSQPSLLLVHPLEEMEALSKIVDQPVSQLTILGNLDVLLYKEMTLVKPTEFLTSSMALKDAFPVVPYQVMDRLTGSTSKGKVYTVWLIRTSHRSHSESRSPLYRMVPLRLPEENSKGILFTDPEIKYRMIVIQYSMAWERELLEALDMKREHNVICPSSDAAHSNFCM